MIDIKSMDTNYININKFQTYGMDGTPTLEVQVSPGFELQNMQARLDSLQLDFDLLLGRLNAEDALIQSHPSVKDAYDKYKVIAALAKVEKDGKIA